MYYFNHQGTQGLYLMSENSINVSLVFLQLIFTVFYRIQLLRSLVVKL